MKNKYFYLFGLLLIILAVYVSQSNIKIYSFSILAFFIGIVAIAIIPRYGIFISILFIFFFFPQMNRYEILPVIDYRVGLAILGILLLAFISRIELKNSFNFLWIIFIFYLFFQTVRGIHAGYSSKFIFDETVKYLFYPLGFYFTLGVFRSDKANSLMLKNLFKFTLIMGTIIVFQMLAYYFLRTGGSRVITRQANLLLYSLMTSLTIIVFKKDLSFIKKSILSLFSLFFIFGMIIFMQRSLWIAVVVSILTFVIVYLFKSNFKASKLITLIILIILISSSILFMFNVMAKSNTILEERTSEVQDEGVGTLSLMLRLLSYYEILHKIRKDWIIGMGVGDEIRTSYLNKPIMNIVDNSYLVLLWKFGLIGFLLFSTIFGIALYQMIYLIRNSEGTTQLFAIIVFTNLIGQFVNGLACVILVLYYYNFIWVSQIAIINILYLKQKKLNNNIEGLLPS